MTLCFAHRKEDPFVRLDKRMVMDKGLSWKAKGILSYAFSRPEDWQFYRAEMIEHATDGKDSFDSGIIELEKAGYLHREKKQNESGRFDGLDWHFFEVPITDEEFKKSYQGGFSAYRFSPRSEKSASTKKEGEETKNNNNSPEVVVSSASPKEPPEPEAAEVVVIPILDELQIPDAMKIKLSAEMDDAKAAQLVKRIKAWVGRGSDALACNTILAQWDTWEDKTSKEDLVVVNRDWAKRNLALYDGRPVGRYQCWVLNKHVEFCGQGSVCQPKCFNYENKDFQALVTDFMKNNLKNGS